MTRQVIYWGCYSVLLILIMWYVDNKPMLLDSDTLALSHDPRRQVHHKSLPRSSVLLFTAPVLAHQLSEADDLRWRHQSESKYAQPYQTCVFFIMLTIGIHQVTPNHIMRNAIMFKLMQDRENCLVPTIGVSVSSFYHNLS